MNYILKKIEKKVYINFDSKLLYLFISKNSFFYLYLTNIIIVKFNFKNINFFKFYLIESGILKS
jgi:hypothetical protein